MKKVEILNKISKLPVPNIGHGDIQVIMRLVTILAATHLANKVNKVIKEIKNLENPDSIIRFLK